MPLASYDTQYQNWLAQQPETKAIVQRLNRLAESGSQKAHWPLLQAASLVAQGRPITAQDTLQRALPYLSLSSKVDTSTRGALLDGIDAIHELADL